MCLTWITTRPWKERNAENELLNTDDFTLCVFRPDLCCSAGIIPNKGGECATGGFHAGGVSPSLGLWSTSVFSPWGLVTTMDVSGVTKLYFSDSLKASSFTFCCSGPDNCSLCHKLLMHLCPVLSCTCVFKQTVEKWTNLFVWVVLAWYPVNQKQETGLCIPCETKYYF